MDVTLENAITILNATKTLSREMRTMANREFRRASADISNHMAREIATGKYASGAPQAYKVSLTARRKSDRIPMVRIPGKRVGLSGQGGRSASSGRRVKFRNRSFSGKSEDQRIAWAATGGRPNPHFPGSTYWPRAARADATKTAGEYWLEAAMQILRRYGLN